MKNVIVCDLDGTLADCEHRVHHVQKTDGSGLKRKPDWDAFYAGIPQDGVNPAVNAILYSVTAGHERPCEIIFCSGRPEKYRGMTVDWLSRVAHFYPSEYTLLMRADGDYRSDDVVKQEILDKHIPKDRVLFVLDDRQRVVDMWRRNGLTCLQVAQGNF
jgi:hypothetical protein